MKAFLSYSVNDDSRYLISLLSSKLQDNNFTTSTSNNFFEKELDYTTKFGIQNSHLFIGAITDTGIEKERVLEELAFAQNTKIPNILLIEDTVLLDKNYSGNIVRFNRDAPQTAIEKIEKEMNKKPSKSNTSDLLPWLLAGAAIVAIFYFLARKQSQT